MRRFLVMLVAFPLLACQTTAPTESALNYPVAAKGDVVDDYARNEGRRPVSVDGGARLEGSGATGWRRPMPSPIRTCQELPLREHFNTRLTELWNYPRVSVPVVEGGQLFYREEHRPAAAVADLRAQQPDGAAARWSSIPTSSPRMARSRSRSGRRRPTRSSSPTASAEGGADWNTVRVRDIASGKDLPDEVRWMRFSDISWTNDSKGFFYSRYPEPPKNKVLEAALSGQAHLLPPRRHAAVAGHARLRTKGSAGLDRQRQRHRGRPIPARRRCSKAPRTRTACTTPISATRWRRGSTRRSGRSWRSTTRSIMPIGNKGTTLYLRSDKDAPNRKIIAIDLQNPARASAWKTIVPERKEAIENVALIGGRIVAQYLVDVQSRLALFGLDGAPQGEIALPGAGTVGGDQRTRRTRRTSGTASARR